MRSVWFCIIATLFTCLPAAAQPEDQCTYDLGAMMRLDFDAFDQTHGSGWRILGNTPGCEAVTAELIARYRIEKIEDQRRGLMHHEAQLRAAAGQTDAAIALLEELRTDETAPEMLAYRDAELAFLRNDRDALIAARERLMRVPPPEGFSETLARFRERYPDQTPPSWPLNIETVDSLIACFGRPYGEAYGSIECRAARH